MFLFAIPVLAGTGPATGADREPAGMHLAGRIGGAEGITPPGGTVDRVFRLDPRTRGAVVEAHAWPAGVIVRLSCPVTAGAHRTGLDSASRRDATTCRLGAAGPVDIPATVTVPARLKPGTLVWVAVVTAARPRVTAQGALIRISAVARPAPGPAPTARAHPGPRHSARTAPSATPTPTRDRGTPRKSERAGTGTTAPKPRRSETATPEPTRTGTAAPQPTRTSTAAPPALAPATPQRARSGDATPEPAHTSTSRPTRSGTAVPAPTHAGAAPPAGAGTPKGWSGHGRPAGPARRSPAAAGQPARSAAAGQAPVPLPTVSAGAVPPGAGGPGMGHRGAGTATFPQAGGPAPAPILPPGPQAPQQQPSPLPLPRVSRPGNADPAQSGQSVLLPNRAAAAGSSNQTSVFDLVEAQIIGLSVALGGALAALLRPVRRNGPNPPARPGQTGTRRPRPRPLRWVRAHLR